MQNITFTVDIPSGFIPAISVVTVASANNTDKSCEVVANSGSSVLNCQCQGTGSYLYGQLVYFI